MEPFGFSRLNRIGGGSHQVTLFVCSSAALIGTVVALVVGVGFVAMGAEKTQMPGFAETAMAPQSTESQGYEQLFSKPSRMPIESGCSRVSPPSSTYWYRAPEFLNDARVFAVINSTSRPVFIRLGHSDSGTLVATAFVMAHNRLSIPIGPGQFDFLASNGSSWCSPSVGWVDQTAVVSNGRVVVERDRSGLTLEMKEE